jgi:hypothetical protein
MTGKKAKAHFGEVKDNRKEIDTKVNGVVTIELAAAFITIYQESNVSVSSRTERCMVRVLNIILMVENTTAIGLMTVEKDGAFINRKMATDTEENGIIIRKKDGAFIGNFKNDDFNGHGTFYWSNGDKYNGEFKDDEFHGYGVKIYADGTVRKGLWNMGIECENLPK